jgi:hypothetical protein
MRINNGLPPRASAHDGPPPHWIDNVWSLADLQRELFIEEARLAARRLSGMTALLAAGTLVMLTCVPLLQVTAALALAQAAQISSAAAFAWILAASMAVAATLVAVPLLRLRQGLSVFENSRRELRRNLQSIRSGCRYVRRSLI